MLSEGDGENFSSMHDTRLSVNNDTSMKARFFFMFVLIIKKAQSLRLWLSFLWIILEPIWRFELQTYSLRMSCSTDWAKLAYFNILQAVLWTRRESNSHRQNRNLKFYPLNYESLLKKRHKDKIKMSLLQRWANEKRWMFLLLALRRNIIVNCCLCVICHITKMMS